MRKTVTPAMRREDQDRRRGEALGFYQIIEQVENNLGLTDLTDNQLFVKICLALKEGGYELHPDDEARLLNIQAG